MIKLNELTLGHIYRWQELTGKEFDQLDTNGVKDLGLLLYIMGGEPEGQKVHEFLNQFKVSELRGLAGELRGALKSGPLASVPKAGQAKGAE